MIEASLRAAKTNNYAITHHVPTMPKEVGGWVGGLGEEREGDWIDATHFSRIK